MMAMPDPPFDAKQKYWGFDAEAWVEPLAPPPVPGMFCFSKHYATIIQKKYAAVADVLHVTVNPAASNVTVNDTDDAV